MPNEITTEMETRALTARDIRAQVNLIQEVMKEVMKKDVHYGIIPGCKKPSLYKPGSEKILATFRLAVEPIVEDLSHSDEARFRVKTKLTHMGSGVFVGSGIGECSSDEEKYKWRKAVCEEEYNDTPEDRKREKWVKGYDKPAYKVKQVRTNIADVANTILKMAKKRSQIDATLTATAASDVFDQDIEDLPPEIQQEIANDQAPQSTKPEVAMPRSKAETGPQPAHPAPQATQPSNPAPTGPVISDPQRKRLYAIAMSAGMNQEQFKEFLLFNYEIEDSRTIGRSQYDEICKAAEAWKNE
jgi:hypothetical protein